MKKKLLLSLAVICFGMLIFGALGVSAATYGDLTYTVSDGEVTITDCNESATEIVIPDEIDGKPVKSIGYRAFSDCSSLESITIPDSVTIIEGYAFDGCESITSLYIPESIVKIDEYAFYCCVNLDNIIIPNSVITIEKGAFFLAVI